jgi:hypothetical protein
MRTATTLNKAWTLAYSRPPGNFAVQDAQMDLLRKRYNQRMRFERSSPLRAAWKYRTWTSAQQPMLLLLRGNQVVYAAIGRLPTRELETAVERALGDQQPLVAQCG